MPAQQQNTMARKGLELQLWGDYSRPRGHLFLLADGALARETGGCEDTRFDWLDFNKGISIFNQINSFKPTYNKDII